MTKRVVTRDREVATEGIVDALHLTSRRTATPLVTGSGSQADITVSVKRSRITLPGG